MVFIHNTSFRIAIRYVVAEPVHSQWIIHFRDLCFGGLREGSESLKFGKSGDVDQWSGKFRLSTSADCPSQALKIL